VDIIPGLAYFTKAADILGELLGGSDLPYIQANLLAGLYMGQLARILPSYSYISQACVAAQILVESSSYALHTMRPTQRNLIHFAFWSCLQLEGDIADEVELPLSSITGFENTQIKEIPTSITLGPIPELGVRDDIFRCYSYQIQLRLIINSIHNTLYRSSKARQTTLSSYIVMALDENLEGWRKTLNDWDWDDSDYECSNINIARVRDKYYCAKKLIWRPVLYNALLQGEALMSESQSSESPLNSDLLNGSKICVDAAIRSTTVFDRIPRRLIVTNYFGTAHAYV